MISSRRAISFVYTSYDEEQTSVRGAEPAKGRLGRDVSLRGDCRLDGVHEATMIQRRTALQIDEEPSEEEMRDLGARLSAFTESRTGRPLNSRRFAVWLREADGRLVGGLVGITYWDWLRIDNLWLDKALRGHGWGRRLLMAAERVAVKRGCRGAWLDTRSFQAPAFFQRMGYQQFGELEELSPDGRRHWFWRKLEPRGVRRTAAHRR